MTTQGWIQDLKKGGALNAHIIIKRAKNFTTTFGHLHDNYW